MKENCYFNYRAYVKKIVAYYRGVWCYQKFVIIQYVYNWLSVILPFHIITQSLFVECSFFIERKISEFFLYYSCISNILKKKLFAVDSLSRYLKLTMWRRSNIWLCPRGTKTLVRDIKRNFQGIFDTLNNIDVWDRGKFEKSLS